MMRCGLPGPGFETFLARYRWRSTFCTRGRRYPAGAISVSAAMFGLGPGALRAHPHLTRRGCLNAAPFGARSEFRGAGSRPDIAAQSPRQR